MTFKSHIVGGLVLAVPSVCLAQGGLVSLGGIGYEGSITRFNSLNDAQHGVNARETMNVRHRDISMFLARNDAIVSDRNVLVSDFSGGVGPQVFPLNDPGRSAAGTGVMQLLDVDGSTGTNVSMGFDTYDGSHFTRFNLNIRGENATSVEDSASLALDSQQMASGVWRSWAVDLTATGLRGSETAPGVIEATDGPSGLEGTLTGIFEMFPDDSDHDRPSYYVIEFDLGLIDTGDGDGGIPLSPTASMVNTGGVSNALGSTIFRSAQAIPMPTPFTLAAAGLIGLAGVRRRR